MAATRKPTAYERREHRRECWLQALRGLLASANTLAEAIDALGGPDAQYQDLRMRDATDNMDAAKKWIAEAGDL